MEHRILPWMHHVNIYLLLNNRTTHPNNSSTWLQYSCNTPLGHTGTQFFKFAVMSDIQAYLQEESLAAAGRVRHKILGAGGVASSSSSSSSGCCHQTDSTAHASSKHSCDDAKLLHLQLLLALLPAQCGQLLAAGEESCCTASPPSHPEQGCCRLC